MMQSKAQYSSVPAPEIPGTDVPRRLPPWTLEVSAATFSVCCNIANIFILWSIDGKPYEAWQLLRTAITPNTLISIVSTLAKSSLLLTIAASLGQTKWLHFQRNHELIDIQILDEATRGPLGAIRLLWSTKFRSILASVGSVLTILALAIDPFVQQVLVYPSIISVASNETCTVGALSAMPGPGLLSGEAGLLVQADSILKLTGALAQGKSGEPVEPLYTCTSANCTWPRFQSIGVCSQCKDLTDAVSIECADNLANTCSYAADDGHIFFANWTYHANNSSKDQLQPSNILEMHVYNSSWLLNNLDGSQMDSVLNASVAEISTFRLDAIYESTASQKATEHRTIRPSIQHCTLNLCLKDYRHSYSIGSSFRDVLIADTALAINFSACTGWMRPNTTGDSSTRCPLLPMSEKLPSSSPGTNDAYWIEIVNFLSLEYVLVRELNISASGDGDSASEIAGLTYWYANDGNISRTLEDIATSLTNQMRRHENVTMINGTVYMPITYVKVNWPWLIYPVSISVFAACFLLAAIVGSWQLGVPVWKSSSLALLFLGPREEVQAWNVNSIPEMEDLASKVKARLAVTEDGHCRLECKPVDEIQL